ncbi:hypothetical protein [Lactobacillus sp. HT06-2]|uniref:hypothetical protein n=1 Tax=Lactobacillus sp. HT06-2 TaxID=2080222 RepID=UPI000CD9CA77|nr:hypothetical protein [Lactobacillus sp. HT06-2]
MKKNKIFTALLAVSLLGGTGAALVNANNQPVQAATKKAKKTYKYGRAVVRANAPAYTAKFDKNVTKVTKVVRYKTNGKKAYMRAKTFSIAFYFNYKGTKYYCLKGSALTVKAKDAKLTRKAPSFKKSVVYKNARKIEAENAAKKAKANEWQSKLDAITDQMKSYSAKTNDGASYVEVNSDGKTSQDIQKMPIGTELTVIYKIPGIFSNGGNKADGYFAITKDDKRVVVAASQVSLDDSNAKVLTQDEYSNLSKQLESTKKEAYKDLGIKDNN